MSGPVRLLANAVADGRIVLSEVEQQILATCVGTVAHFQLQTTVRVAGGWVRDKLLGLPSDDIDIALDTMLGKEFAQYVNQFLAIKVAFCWLFPSHFCLLLLANLLPLLA